jgi:hypothetical protein
MTTDWHDGAYQPTLFEEEPRARHTDPETSHDAAASVKELRRRQAAVWYVLDMEGPLTDEELVKAYAVRWPHFPQSPSGLRTRRAELVARGLVEWTGRRRPLVSGRLAREWDLRR